MQLTCYLPLILTLLATSSASFAHTPAVAKRQDELTPFKLRTEVINGGDNNLAGLYVQSYHTGMVHPDTLPLPSPNTTIDQGV